jgi:TP901 family phage tail tape measure protein
MLFKLSAQLGREFSTTFGTAKRTLTETQKEINALNQTQADISSYQKQQQAVENTSRKLSDLQKEYDNIQREIQETEGFSSSLENKLIEKQRAIDKTSESLKNQTDKLHQMESAMQDAGIDTDHLADESKKLTQQMDDLAKKQAEAAKEAQNFGVEGVSSFEAVGSALVAAGIAAGLKAIYDEYKECVSIAADFEETMSTVEALSGATAEEMQALSSYAKQLGATTKFTAKESAEAMTYMGMAGWDAGQMIEGMSGVLNLAAASGEDLATTADIVTDNLTAFGMKASDTAHFSDVLAAAATNSNTSVAIMGETFKNCAALAGALNYSIEDVAVAIGLMANAGIKGSIAGTALKNVFNGLLSGVTLTAEAFGEVEYSAINADGTMKSFGETMQELRGYFDQMTGAEKMQNAETLAGQRAMAGFVSIMNSTDADFQKLTASINDCSGAAQKMADIKMDNLNGQLTLMNSAADALKTTIGEAYNEELRALAKVATDILSGINDFLTEHPILLKSIIAITAEVGTFLLVYNSLIVAKKLFNTLKELGITLNIKSATAATSDAIAKGAQATATEGAASAQTGLNAAMAANPVGLVLTAVTALTVGLVALVQVIKNTENEEEKLMLKSRQQKKELDELNAEYKETVELYGETSYEAQSLKWRIDELTESYENGKQTVKEYIDSMKSYHEMRVREREEYKNAFDEIDATYEKTTALVAKLDELSASSGSLAKNQSAVAAIVSALNGQYGDLGLTFDATTGKFNKSVSELREYARQMHDTAEAEKKFEEYTEALAKKDIDEQNLNTAWSAYEPHKKQIEEAKKAYEDYVGSFAWFLEQATVSSYDIPYSTFLAMDWNEKEKAAEKIKNTYEEAKNDYDATVKTINEFEEKYGFSEEKAIENTEDLQKAVAAVVDEFMTAKEASEYYGVSLTTLEGQIDAVTNAQELLKGAAEYVREGFFSIEEAASYFGIPEKAIEAQIKIEELAESIDLLSTSYENVKEAAEKSIEGQYKLWDVAADVIPKSIDDINSALETQRSYWSDYNTDLANLLARTDEIDGLSEIIASFADGSAESVNAIAGMAAASDEDLRKMVGNWQQVQKQQKEAATSIAELATGFTEELDNMKSDLEEAVDALNLDDEAATAAKETIDAYVQAIRDGTDDAVKAANKLKTLVAAELNGIDTVSTPDNTSFGRFSIGGQWMVSPYASGTDSAKSGLALVGEKGPELVMFNGGEQVLTADETRAYMRQLNDSRNAINAYAEGAGEYTELIMILPTIARMLEAIPHIDAISAGNGQHIVITISPTFSVQGGSDMEDTLHAFSDELKDEIFDALEEAGIDAKRGVYA